MEKVWDKVNSTLIMEGSKRLIEVLVDIYLSQQWRLTDTSCTSRMT